MLKTNFSNNYIYSADVFNFKKFARMHHCVYDKIIAAELV